MSKISILDGTGDATATSSSKAQWRSLEELHGDPSLGAMADRESPQAQREADVASLSRRGFMGFTTASLAAASAVLSGCIRKPREHILPYTKRPEDLLPGVPWEYATTAPIGQSVLGLVVKSQDGRPSKVDGNPLHGQSLGRSNVWAQASIHDLYNPDRSREVLHGDGRRSWTDEGGATWEDFDTFAATHFPTLQARGGEGLALLIQHRPSPTFQHLLRRFREEFPKAKVFVDDVALRSNEIAGAALVGMDGKTLASSIKGAQVIVALDHDFLGGEGDSVRLSAEFADGRRLRGAGSKMNRLYAVEPGFTATGAMADNRLRLRASQVGGFLAALAKALFGAGVTAPAGAEAVASKLADGDFGDWPAKLAADLVANRGESVLLIGERQGPAVHALALMLNVALGNLDRTVSLERFCGSLGDGGLAELKAGIGAVKTLVVMGGNPVYEAPAELGMAAALQGVETLIHHGQMADETGKLAGWHLPAAHFLEAWGDWRSSQGQVGLQQPLVAPLFDSRSELELLSVILGKKRGGHELVRATWEPAFGAGFEKRWRRWLHDGVMDDTSRGLFHDFMVAKMTSVAPDGEQLQDAVEDQAEAPAAPAALAWAWAGLAEAAASLTASQGGMELDLSWDGKLFDGRYANNPWLQELPDTMSKLSWDNAALVSPKTARELGVQQGDMVEVSASGQKVSMAVLPSPGVADGAVVSALGYGRTAGGRWGTEPGWSVASLRTVKAPWIVEGVSVTKASGHYELATSQNHHRLEPRPGWKPRPLIREATLKEYNAKPDYPLEQELLPPERLKSLWDSPNPTEGQQWGMSIDLSVCTGCNACTVACQAENNISVVGKERCLDGREMSWIRLDRYYTGDEDNPEAVLQPIACSQCETAPCEGVCPVAATSHSPEGLNDIAYNRCIGTRYCANNCPYKVRRYNFFNYSKENDTDNENLPLMRNQNVTVRFRGVIEKCTYCVQRINQAKIEAKREGRGAVADGAIVVACEQVCPTQAIVFGDTKDPDSRVSKMKALEHDYALLSELNLYPRTTFLGKVRNPNPELA